MNSWSYYFSYLKKITFTNALKCRYIYSSDLYSHLSASFELRWCIKSLCFCFPALHKLVLWLTNVILSLRKWMLFSIILSGIIKTIIRHCALINFFPFKLEHSSYPKSSRNFLWSQNWKCKGKPGMKKLSQLSLFFGLEFINGFCNYLHNTK